MLILILCGFPAGMKLKKKKRKNKSSSLFYFTLESRCYMVACIVLSLVLSLFIVLVL